MKNSSLSKKVFSTNLIKLRERLHLSQEQLAEKVDLSRIEIANYEREHSFPSAKSLDKIVQNLGISISELFSTSEATVISEDTLNEIHSCIDTIIMNPGKLASSLSQYHSHSDRVE